MVARGKACCTLYKTQTKVCKNGLYAAENNSSPNLWHRRFGHMSEEGLQTLAKKFSIPYTKGISLDPCHQCLVGKHHRIYFSSSSERKSDILYLVYLMYVVISRLNLLVGIIILLLLLMMLIERFGFI